MTRVIRASFKKADFRSLFVKTLVNLAIKKKANELFSGYNCVQAVFADFLAVIGVDEKTALKLSPFFFDFF